MRGLFRAEVLRLRKRRSLQAIVIAVPLLVAAFFALGYGSIYDQPPFDPVQLRAQLIAEGYAIGLPPDEAERLLDEQIEMGRQLAAQQEESEALSRAAFAFPYSLVTALGSTFVVLFAVILLAATTTGDDFGWGTVRTSLIASSHRHRLLFVRFVTQSVVSLAMFGSVLVVGVALPILIGVGNKPLPATLPPLDVGALAVLLMGTLLAAAALTAFSTLATLIVRSGALALVAVVVYVVVEGAVLALLLRFEPFQQEGDLEWTLDGLPFRGIVTLLGRAGQAATGLPGYPGHVVVRELGFAALPMTTLAIVALVFAALAFRRFQRMDIVE